MGVFQHLITVLHFSRSAVCKDGNTAGRLWHHIQFPVRKQCSHTEFSDRRENALDAFQCDPALGLTAQLLRQGCRNLVAQSIGNDDIHLVLAGCHLTAVERLLLTNLQNASILSKFIGTNIRPVAAQLRQEPAVIQPFHLFNNMLEQIVKHFIGDGQAVIKAQMELSIIGIHLVVVSCVGFPNLTCLRKVESGCVFL